MATTKINFNQQGIVTLQKEGVRAYEKYYEDLGLEPPEKLKEGDTLKTELWKIANIFGPSFFHGGEPPLKMTFDLLGFQ
jgi:hypothetical protein